MELLRAKVVASRFVTQDVLSIILEQDKPLTYIPGQYIVVRIPNIENNIVGRSYSIASQAGESTLTLLVKLVEQGVGSVYLKSLKMGDEVVFTGPFGKFVLKEENMPAVFIGTGTGVAPFIPMIEERRKRSVTTPTTLLLGFRTEQDILELPGVWEGDSNITSHICISQPSDDWTEERGRVTDYLRKNPHILKDSTIYICGNGSMVDEVKTFALEYGVPDAHIVLERYNSI